jgi:hypothetical protein
LGLFAASLDPSVAAIHQIFDLAVKSGKQVFRLLDIGDGESEARSEDSLLTTILSHRFSL